MDSKVRKIRPVESNGWMGVLAEECRRDSQSKVAKRLGVSPALVNQVLKGLYRGDMNRIQARVEGAYMHHTVDCPVLEEIPLDQCINHQERPRRFATANPLFTRLYRACRSGCPYSTLKQEY